MIKRNKQITLQFAPSHLLLMLSALWLAASNAALAKPTIEVDLASKIGNSAAKTGVSSGATDSLNTEWTFQPDTPGAQPKALTVPAGGWRLNGFPDADAGTYERRITIPRLPEAVAKSAGGQTTLLAFEAVNWEAIVSVGPDAAHLIEAGRNLSAWTPFRVDISRYSVPGQSLLLRVHVRDRNYFKDAQGRYTVPYGTEWNDRHARGIIRGVSLQVYPAVYIDDVFVRPNTADSTFACDAKVVNTSDSARTVTLTGAFSAAKGAPKQSVGQPSVGASNPNRFPDRANTTASSGHQNSGTNGKGRKITGWNYPALSPHTLTIAAHSVGYVRSGTIVWTAGRESWWWPNVPYRPNYRTVLHNLTLTLRPSDATPGSAPSQAETTRFGFCTPGQRGNTYTLNGVRINLRGDSLPESTIGTDAFARLPGFLPPTASSPGWPGSVRNYQRLNYNVVRMHQIPCTRYMMDVCDELGLLVIPETAIRMAGGGKQNLTALPSSFTDHLRALILRDRNHPSVFKWSLENELFGAPEAFVRTLYDTCQAADGTRPCSIDDNADYPSWKNFAVISHYSQPPGTPDAAGGRPRTDRPYGEGEFVWPQSNSQSAPVWFGLETRSLRLHDNADIRPYTLIDLWPGVISGLTPTNFPDPSSPPNTPNTLEQGGKALLDLTKPWASPAIQLVQKSFSPVAAFDREYDIANTATNGEGYYPARMPMLPAAKTTRRQIAVFNDDMIGSELELKVTPTLQFDSGGADTGADIKKQRRLPTISRKLVLAPGEHTTVLVDIPVPEVKANTVLELGLRVSKGGLKNGLMTGVTDSEATNLVGRFEEKVYFVIMPPINGAQARYLRRDDTTHGNWRGVYGMQGFLVPIFGESGSAGRAIFQLPTIDIQRGTGIESEEPTLSAHPTPQEIRDLAKWREQKRENAERQGAMLELADNKVRKVDDPRVPLGGGDLSERHPIAFASGSTPLVTSIRTTDGQPHVLSLYLLDYSRRGQAMDIFVFDLQGHPLDTRRIDNYGEGCYVRYEFTGSLFISLHSLTDEGPLLNGVFVDAAPVKPK